VGENCYPVGIDSTQKIAFSTLWDEHLLQRRIGPKVDPERERSNATSTTTSYVLEASPCFQNGMVIPLMSEFLDYEKGSGEQRKQDCETKAFHRLAELGVQAAIGFIRNTLTGPWLDHEKIEQHLS
jgi:hypothetical protein